MLCQWQLWPFHREIRFGPCFRISHSTSKYNHGRCKWDLHTQLSNLRQEEKERPWEEGKSNVFASSSSWNTMDLYGFVISVLICDWHILKQDSVQFQAVGSVLCRHLWRTSGDLTSSMHFTDLASLHRSWKTMKDNIHGDLSRSHHNQCTLCQANDLDVTLAYWWARYCFQWREGGNKCIELACSTTEQNRWHTLQAHTRDLVHVRVRSFSSVLSPEISRDAQVGGRGGFPHLCYHIGW